MVNDGTSEQQNQITQYFRNKEVGWWHWLSDVWLVVDSKNQLKASKLRDELNDLVPGVRKIVLEVEGGTWSAYCHSDSFDWLHGNWND